MEQNEDILTKRVVKRRKRSREPWVAFGFILFLLIGFTAGYFTNSNKKEVMTPEGSLYNFERVYNTINDNWFFLDELDESLETLAIKGLLDQLGDMHTSYMSKEDSLSFMGSMDNNYSGIGAVVTNLDDNLHIKMVVAGSPAEEAGLKSGDKILKVDGVSVEGKTSSELAELIRGETGTTVVVTIERDNVAIDYEITRRPLDSSVMYEIRENDGVRFGFIHITTFGSSSATYVEQALNYFKDQGIEELVIDLRDNTGGYLNTVNGILNLFFEEGEVLFQVQDTSGVIEKYKATKSETYTFEKGYVLINQNTASASEVMAGALHELLDYKLVGSYSYGKGTAQTTITLTDLSTLKYTYAKWLLPSGESIDGVGLKPDYEVANVELNSFSIIEIKENLVYDTVSDEVKAMQRMLKTIGYAVDREDGYFSAQTKKALESFEKDKKLTIDGTYSQQDNEALITALLTYAGLDENDHQYLKVLELIK